MLTWNNHATRIKAESELGSLTSRLRVVHHKRGRAGICLEFKWRETDDGIAPDSVRADNAPPPKRPSGANQRLALDCLNRVVAEHVEPHPGHTDIPAHAKLARFNRVQDLFARIAPVMSFGASVKASSEPSPPCRPITSCATWRAFFWA